MKDQRENNALHTVSKNKNYCIVVVLELYTLF